MTSRFTCVSCRSSWRIATNTTCAPIFSTPVWSALATVTSSLKWASVTMATHLIAKHVPTAGAQRGRPARRSMPTVTIITCRGAASRHSHAARLIRAGKTLTFVWKRWTFWSTFTTVWWVSSYAVSNAAYTDVFFSRFIRLKSLNLSFFSSCQRIHRIFVISWRDKIYCFSKKKPEKVFASGWEFERRQSWAKGKTWQDRARTAGEKAIRETVQRHSVSHVTMTLRAYVTITLCYRQRDNSICYVICDVTFLAISKFVRKSLH